MTLQQHRISQVRHAAGCRARVTGSIRLRMRAPETAAAEPQDTVSLMHTMRQLYRLSLLQRQTFQGTGTNTHHDKALTSRDSKSICP